MNLHPTRSEHHTLRPSELAAALAHFVEARQPCIVWGPPGPANSMIAHQVAAATNRQPLDIQTLLLDPAHFRGIPRHDGTNPTQSSLPAFLPPSHDTGRWLINLQDLPSTAPPVQATLYQLLLDRHFGDYELPDHASLIASGSRETHPGAVCCFADCLITDFSDYFARWVRGFPTVFRDRRKMGRLAGCRTGVGAVQGAARLLRFAAALRVTRRRAPD